MTLHAKLYVQTQMNQDIIVYSDDARMKVLQIFERVWSVCPAVTALDRNIGYLETATGVYRIMQTHIEGERWERKFLRDKTTEEKLKILYDRILAREPTPEELATMGWIAAEHLVEGMEYYIKFRQYETVPGCGREGMNCSWMRKYSELFHFSGIWL